MPVSGDKGLIFLVSQGIIHLLIRLNTLIHSGIKQDYLVIYSTDLFKTTDSVSAFFCRLHNYRWPKGGDRGLFFWENLWSFYSTGYLQKDCHYVLVVGIFQWWFSNRFVWTLNTQICSWMKQVSLLIIHLPDSFKNTDLFSDCFCRLHSLVTPVCVDKGQFLWVSQWIIHWINMFKHTDSFKNKPRNCHEWAIH